MQKVNPFSTKFTLVGDNGSETKHTVHAKSVCNLWTPEPYTLFYTCIHNQSPNSLKIKKKHLNVRQSNETKALYSLSNYIKVLVVSAASKVMPMNTVYVHFLSLLGQQVDVHRMLKT